VSKFHDVPHNILTLHAEIHCRGKMSIVNNQKVENELEVDKEKEDKVKREMAERTEWFRPAPRRILRFNSGLEMRVLKVGELHIMGSWSF